MCSRLKLCCSVNSDALSVMALSVGAAERVQLSA